MSEKGKHCTKSKEGNMKKTYHVVSFSGGKDSTAMLLHMLELGMPVDEVVNVDTGMEFPEMYRHIAKVRAVVEAAGVKFTRLKADKSFEYYLTRYPIKRRNPELAGVLGCGWPGPRSRWCTGKLKVNVLRKYTRDLRNAHNVIWYIGLAADETGRLARKHNNADDHRHPLTEWGWTEADALKYCYDHGYDWEGLYTLFKRVSCWCCPLQPLEELRKLRRHFPDLWKRLFELDSQQCRRNFNANNSLAQLEARFALEEERVAQGLTINARSKEFKNALAERLEKQECREGEPHGKRESDL